jgi:hypothetical protein
LKTSQESINFPNGKNLSPVHSPNIKSMAANQQLQEDDHDDETDQVRTYYFSTLVALFLVPLSSIASTSRFITFSNLVLNRTMMKKKMNKWKGNMRI